MCYCLSAGGIGVSADLWRSLSKLRIVMKLMMYELQSMCFVFCSHYQHSISLHIDLPAKPVVVESHDHDKETPAQITVVREGK